MHSWSYWRNIRLQTRPHHNLRYGSGIIWSYIRPVESGCKYRSNFRALARKNAAASKIVRNYRPPIEVI